MDKEKTRVANRARRGFLRAAGGAGALGALAVAAGQGAAAPVVAVPQAPAEPVRQTGYHETEHIRQYYRSARYW
jgi:hypothetical protein